MGPFVSKYPLDCRSELAGPLRGRPNRWLQCHDQPPLDLLPVRDRLRHESDHVATKGAVEQVWVLLADHPTARESNRAWPLAVLALSVNQEQPERPEPARHPRAPLRSHHALSPGQRSERTRRRVGVDRDLESVTKPQALAQVV